MELFVYIMYLKTVIIAKKIAAIEVFNSGDPEKIFTCVSN